MPELPEVETVRRTLEPKLIGRRILGLTLGSFPGVIGSFSAEELSGLLTGRRVVAVRRRGKYLLIDLDDDARLTIHLRMTGVLQLSARDDEPLRFQHLSLQLDDGSELRFADQRKFGRVLYSPPGSADDLEARLGPEPLSDRFTDGYVLARLRGRAASIKALLLDQRIVAGIGNIYADEALFLAGLHPTTPGGKLTQSDAGRLTQAIKQVLETALTNRGTTFSSYRDADGQMGENQHRLWVYGRGRRGDPCPTCGASLTVLTVAQRSSHVCPNCQPLRAGTTPTAN